MDFISALLSNWYFVGGVTGCAVWISVLIGYLLARAKIKKGFDIYED